jgi:hypothetical protein
VWQPRGQLKEIRRYGLESFGATRLDRCGRRIDADHVDTRVSEVASMHARSGSELDQGTPVLGKQPR